MAFFRNYSDNTLTHNVPEENEERQDAATFQSSPLNEDVDGTYSYSERVFDMNMDVHYQSGPEPGCSMRRQNQTTIGNIYGPVDSHYKAPEGEWVYLGSGVPRFGKTVTQWDRERALILSKIHNRVTKKHFILKINSQTTEVKK